MSQVKSAIIDLDIHNICEPSEDGLSCLKCMCTEARILDQGCVRKKTLIHNEDRKIREKELDDPSNIAMRFNAGKPQLSYPLSTGIALEGVARVMEFGAKKYARDNWKKGLDPRSILDSMARHIAAYLDGEYIDPDSGLPHIDHIACNGLFLGYHTDRETQDGMK